MKMMKKKSLIYALGVAIVLSIALLRVFFMLHTRMDDMREGQDFAIGTNQMDVLEAVQKAEKSLVYGEESFSLAVQQSIYKFANYGSTSATSCGKSGGFDIWRNNDAECYPKIEGVKNEIAKMAANTLKNYLASNPYHDIGSKDFDFEIFFEQKEGKLTARAYSSNPAVQRIICSYGKPPLLKFSWFEVTDIFADEVKGSCGIYAYKNNFRKVLDFDINDFNKAAEQAKQLSAEVEGCMGNGKSAKACFDENKGAYSKITECSPAPSDTSFNLCYETGKKLMVYNPAIKKASLEDIKIGFALSFS